MCVFDRVYLGRIGSWLLTGIGLLIAADVRFDFLLRGGRDGMSELVNEIEDNFPLDDVGCKRFDEFNVDVLLFCRFIASSGFGSGSVDDVSFGSDSASANFPTTGSKLSEMPSEVR